MVLSSQMARPGTTRSNMYARGSAKRNRAVAIVGGGAVLLLAAWWFWPNSTSGAQGRTGSDEAVKQAGLGNQTGDDAHPDVKTLASNGQPNRDQPWAEPDSSNGDFLLPRGIDPGALPVESPASDAKAEKDSPGGGAMPLTMGQTPAGKENPDSFSKPSGPEEPVNNAQPEPATPARAFVASDVSAEVVALLERADREIDTGRLVEGRATLNEALSHPRAGSATEQIRTRLAELNAMMVFGKTVVKGDPFATTHVIRSGDRLVFIARDHAIDHRFIALINGMSNPDQIRLGQSLKVINGPFHVEIDKSNYRLDVYLGAAGSAQRTYVRSFFIGLGELGSTPTGEFRVRSNSKLENPAWTNPRTGEHFKSGDPKNPIGNFWIGLEGTDEQTRLLDGYGIHGTIDQTSIGRQMSMGCVRLYDADIEMLYGMLVPEKSTVIIRD